MWFCRNLFVIGKFWGFIQIQLYPVPFELWMKLHCVFVWPSSSCKSKMNLLLYYQTRQEKNTKMKEKNRTSNTYLFRSKNSTPQINNNNFKQCLPILQILRWQPHPFPSRISILSAGNIVPPARQNARARIININTGTFEFQKHCVPTWRYIRWRLLRNRIWKRKNNSLV